MAFRRPKELPASIVLPRWWRRHLSTLLVALVLSGAFIVERAGWLARPTPPVVLPDSFNQDDMARYHDQTFRVVHVVDGDTLDIDIPDPGNGKPKTRIRLWGVDCPEINHGGNGNMHFGPEAAAFAKETLEAHDVLVVLSPKRTRDRYGRLLAYIFPQRGGPMFNEMLIEKGFAYADSRFAHHYKTRFAEAERRARDKHAGLWADLKIAEMPKWRQKREKKKSDEESEVSP